MGCLEGILLSVKISWELICLRGIDNFLAGDPPEELVFIPLVGVEGRYLGGEIGRSGNVERQKVYSKGICLRKEEEYSQSLGKSLVGGRKFVG